MLVSVMSAVAANRKQFFDLVEALERDCCCKIDDAALQAEIDTNFSGCDRLSNEEAQTVLMRVSMPKEVAVPIAAPSS